MLFKLKSNGKSGNKMVLSESKKKANRNWDKKWDGRIILQTDEWQNYLLMAKESEENLTKIEMLIKIFGKSQKVQIEVQNLSKL